MVHPFSPYMGMTAYTLILTTIQYEVVIVVYNMRSTLRFKRAKIQTLMDAILYFIHLIRLIN